MQPNVRLIPSVIVRVCFMSTRTTGGFVGKGALSAAVCGDVFSSPTQDAILTAIRNVAGPPGVLLIVKNYTGDKLNFGLAAEIAKSEGYAVEMVTVADDVALLESEHEIGARGIAGTVFLHKIVGAAAESGASLQTVAELARSVARGLSLAVFFPLVCPFFSEYNMSYLPRSGENDGCGSHVVHHSYRWTSELSIKGKRDRTWTGNPRGAWRTKDKADVMRPNRRFAARHFVTIHGHFTSRNKKPCRIISK